jgi:tRNA 2-selenouridine synthase
MEQAPVLELQRTLPERVAYLITLYGTAGTTALLEATQRIHKRLGSEKTQRIKAHIEAGDLGSAIEGVLSYYDKTYRYDLERRTVSCVPLPVSGYTPEQVAHLLLTL